MGRMVWGKAETRGNDGLEGAVSLAWDNRNGDDERI
jgi:hypothetical protein